MLRRLSLLALVCLPVACAASHTVHESRDADAPRLGTSAAAGEASGPDAVGPSSDSAADLPDADAAPAAPVTDHQIVKRDCDSTPYIGWSAIPVPSRCPEGSPCGTTCLHASDCDDAPFGRCVGGGASRCEYGPERQSAGGPCEADSECTLSAGGQCVASPVPGFRQCEYPNPRFNAYESCDRDSDCTLARDAHCMRELKYAGCQYDGCRVDRDCGARAACVCEYGDHTCVPAECRSDADCPKGHGCHPSQRFTAHTSGLYCTTDADTCSRPTQPCEAQPSKVCAFDTDAGHWACLSSNIITLPL